MNMFDLLRVVSVLLEHGEQELASKVYTEAALAAAKDPSKAPVSPGK